MIVSVINYIKKLESRVNPKLVYIAVDGLLLWLKLFSNVLEDSKML